MASRYELTSEVAGPDGVISASPHWVIGVARYAIPITYDPTTRKSVSESVETARQEWKPLVIEDECISLTIATNRDSHNGSLQAELVDNGTKYLNEILPGDWITANIVYSATEASDIAQRMREGKPVNGWKDGLKFIGRVLSIRKRLSIDPSSGRPRSAYTLSGVAFGELNTALMYFPELANQQGLPISLYQFGLTVRRMLNNQVSRNGLISPNDIIPEIVAVVFGDGAWSKLPPAGPVSPSPNKPYVVPDTIFKWVGIDDGQTYADLLQPLVGLQKYMDAGTLSAKTPASQAGEAFQPVLLEPLIGAVPLSAIPPMSTTAWAFLSAYVGAPLNEMFATLRCDENGDVYPTLVVRQSPYTTDTATVGNQSSRPVETDEGPQPVERNTEVTQFLSVPRWVISKEIVHGADIGRSDLVRKNVVYAFGNGPGGALNEAVRFYKSLPVQDTIDILRHGVRYYSPNVNCFLEDMTKGPMVWRDLIADFTMGAQLSLNGTVTVVGIRAPIAVGDNLEWEGTVFHIETLTHTANIAADGKRHFVSSMALARGSVEGGNMNPRQFPNVDSTDPETSTTPTTKD